MHSTTSTTVPGRLAVPTASLSGFVVSQLSASAASSTAIRLSWQLQHQQQQHRQVVEGFRVRYRSLDNAAANDVVDYLEKTVRPGDVTQFLLTGESRTCHSIRSFYLLHLSALEVCSRQGAIQIHVYLTLPYLTSELGRSVHPCKL